MKPKDCFIIYGLQDPRTNELRYIGISSNLKIRLDRHYSAPIRSTKEWIGELRILKIRPAVMYLDYVFGVKQPAGRHCRLRNEAMLFEYLWINKCIENGINLLNVDRQNRSQNINDKLRPYSVQNPEPYCQALDEFLDEYKRSNNDKRKESINSVG